MNIFTGRGYYYRDLGRIHVKKNSIRASKCILVIHVFQGNIGAVMLLQPRKSFRAIQPWFTPSRSRTGSAIITADFWEQVGVPDTTTTMCKKKSWQGFNMIHKSNFSFIYTLLGTPTYICRYRKPKFVILFYILV